MLKTNLMRIALLGALTLGMAVIGHPEATASGRKQPPQGLVKAQAARAGQQPGIHTDMEAVLGAQSGPQAGGQLYIPPGLYALGPMNEQRSDHYLLVQNHVNNDAMGIAILIPKRAMATRRGNVRQGYVFQISPTKGGTAMMMSPITINSKGDVVIASEASANQPYLEISLAADKGKGRHFPYLVIPKFGALNELYGNQMLVMRPETIVDNASLLEYPKNGQFEGWSDTGQNLVMMNGQINVNDGSSSISTYRVDAMNSPDFGGSFFQLTRTEDNSITGEGRGGSRIERLAVFVQGCFGVKHLFVLYPLYNANGEYAMHVYVPRGKTLADLLVPLRPAKYKD